MSDLVKIKYVGQEESWSDHLYNSGATWTQGGVVAVPKEAADYLLRHPEFEEAPNARKFDQVEPVEKEVVVEEPPMVNLEAMTKDQLSQYAHRNFGVVMPKKETAESMRNAIRLQMGKKVV
jgi:hypothetical protein